MLTPNRVAASAQLLVEGRDQAAFFRAFVERLEIDGVQVQNFGGVNDLPVFLESFAASRDFRDNVESVGIVRDAETSARSAFQSVQGALRNANLPVPDSPEHEAGESPSVKVFILPDNQSEGMLETLLCETFADTPLDGCIDRFFDCVRNEAGVGLHRPEKARAHAYIATRRDPFVSVWVAAQRGYWNLDHAAFDGVRRFLQSLRPPGENPIA